MENIQTELFEKWVNKEKENGLIDIRFSINDITNNTIETFCGEINEMLSSPILEDKNFF